MYRQSSLFGHAEPAVDAEFGDLRRRRLDDETWVDYCPGWLAGSDDVLDQLAEMDMWRRRRTWMYDRMVDEPRLSAWWLVDDGEREALPVLAEARCVLTARYQRKFDSIGFNYYRDGDDSVAWHADRHRHLVANPIIAIVGVGEPRPFRLRPTGGGRSLSLPSGHGDLLVMGGACQDRWQHCVPKVTGVVGPRVSITYRHDAGRIDRRRTRRSTVRPTVPA